MLHLIPMPKQITATKGCFSLNELDNVFLPEETSSSLLNAIVVLADEMESVTGKRPRFIRSAVAGNTLTMTFDKKIKGDEAYTLKITASGIELSAAQHRGLFYGIQTLRQLIRTEGCSLPCMMIHDAPDFPARGFYHDCTRGKIPTLETLFKLADKLAYYKINQLQLYVEHTFAFARHSDVWAGADPLTAEEIIRLDDYCAERNIELVPSLSTFGHFYMALRSKRKEHLNELDVKGSEYPFSFSDRMAHYTLNASDPDSFKLIEDMLSEFLPLFRSKYFNVCCDETFDLGKGKNKKLVEKLGSGTKLYVQFLKKIIAEVNRNGKIAMFWGDIIAHEPGLIRELPADTIPLEWDYGPQVTRNDTGVLKKSGLKFYVCPGVSGWNQFINNIECASLNIVGYAKKGLKFKASGLLNTDWGDYGHVNLLSCSYHGLALGAACGWNVAGCEDMTEFDEAFSRIEMGDMTGDVIAAWRNASRNQQLGWTFVQLLLDPRCEKKEQLMQNMKNAYQKKYFKAALDAYAYAEKSMMAAFRNAKPLDPLMPDELLCGIRGNRLMHLFFLACIGEKGFDPFRTADQFRVFERELSGLWHKRNKPSEYFRVKDILVRASELLDQTGMKH